MSIQLDGIDGKQQQQQNGIEIEPINMYLCSVCYSLMNVDRDYFYKVLHQEENQQKIKTYCNDTQVKILLISKSEQGNDSKEPEIVFRIEITPTDTISHSIAFIKRNIFHHQIGKNKNDKFIDSSSQFQVINLGYYGNEYSPFELTHNYVQNCFVPLFSNYKSVLENNKQGTADSSKSFNTLQKKLAELNLALIQCQQNIEVPEIILFVEPEIKEKVAKAKTGNKKASIEDFGDILNNPNFINQLVQCVTKWTSDITALIKYPEKLELVSTLQEVNFWLSYERALNHIDQQIKQPEVEITLEILRNRKKFSFVMAFENDMQFKPALMNCISNNSFMKEFPINELLAAGTMQEVQSSLSLIFNHMKKVITLESYSTGRLLNFLEAISRDLNGQLLKILTSFKLMQIPYKEFQNINQECLIIFKKWDNDYQNFKYSMRNHGKKLGNPNFEHQNLSDRLKKLLEFRTQHEKLREVIESILMKESGPHSKAKDTMFLTTHDIQDAYTIFYNIDVLDLSKEGENAIISSIKNYNFKIDKVETQITNKLKDKLGSTNNANEMLRILSKFNALFFRPHIKGAIQEYQVQLLKTVRKDIQGLREKFLRHYDMTDTAKLSKTRDIPPTAGKVIWANQIKRKLKVYMERVEGILGESWHEQPEGRELKELGDTFEKHLNALEFCESWIKNIQTYLNENDYSKERIFDIQQKKKLDIMVNFDDRLIALFKEIRNLTWLKVKLPFTLKFKSDDAQNIYPVAVSLQESLRTFTQVCEKIDERMMKLVASHKREIQTLLQQGMNLTWSKSTNLMQYCKKLADKVTTLEEAVNALNERIDQINAILNSLATCPLEIATLKDKITEVQNHIDQFELQNYANLHIWVPELDQKIEQVLGKRLEELIKSWIKEFETYKMSQRVLLSDASFHELKIQDQVIYVDPPIEYARFYWFNKFHEKVSIICSLQKVEAYRHEVFREGTSKKDNTYSSLLQMIPADVVKGTYIKMDQIISAAENYVKTWLNYQALWEINSKKVYEELGDDIDKWHLLLNEIKSGRQTFDNSETQKYFGAVLIDYRLVQVKINNKYDTWHKEILNQFGLTLNETMRGFFTSISSARQKMEKVNFSATSQDITQFITEIQEFKKQQIEWNNDIEKIRNGHKLLERQRYHFPSDWMWLEQIEGEWSNFRQILNRKGAQMEAEMSSIQQRIITEEQVCLEKIKEVEEMWKNQKPYSGEMLPNQALDTLNIIEGKLQRVIDAYSKVCKAKELLELEPGNVERLEILQEDVQGLKEVWSELNKVWIIIDSMRDTLLPAAQPKKMKQSFDEATDQLNSFPNKLRQYEAFEKMKLRIANYKKMNLIIIEMKSESMKPRHWKTLLTKLRVQSAYNDLTLGHLWQLDVLKYENIIRDVLNVARGEMVLEEMLRAVKEYWNSFELELVRYQNKCKLIKGWDDLFTKVDEDQNNLNSMKMSPYYKTFEEEIKPWDDKLQKIRIIFDIWIDVQRRWIYLEGIFFGSSDIKTQLQNEYTRFKGIDNEFTSLMKKVAQKPIILDVLSIQNLQKTLERIGDMLSKIQKALGDYLETQRSAFARFYFVGDEDLLDIIGNSKDVTNVQRHFTKMFAGITTLTNQDEGDLIIGMNSREGESVPYEVPVKISDNPTINIWLTKVEDQMRLSLAVNLERSIKDIAQSEQTGGQERDELLIKSIEKYPAQVVLLGMQVTWSTKIEKALEEGRPEHLNLESVENSINHSLALLAEKVLTDLKRDLRQKFEQLITDFVHQRDVTRLLVDQKVASSKDFSWQYHMRFYWTPKEVDPLKKLLIRMGNSQFHYGFEYLGVGEKLVQTPLTDKCYLTLTQALHLRMGGNPFGPAGTGKTESVKALGSQLGRFVLVFNCDETFDFNAMGRIFIGLCQVGAWGCFDEFNRLEERMLSACSQQILTIQVGLRELSNKIELMGKDVRLNSQMGIFITMNPGYAGRSNLPENLKQLFRQLAMTKPDRELIAQVMLFSQGYKTAERLAGKIVSLFELCNDQLSSQPHYDFGLRALKSVLVSAGNLKRTANKEGNVSPDQLQGFEQKILLKSVCETIVPKLIADDIPLLQNLLSGVFPGATIPVPHEEELKKAIAYVCQKRLLLLTPQFLEKNLQHGVMMVGPSGCAKSAAWKVLLEAMTIVDKVKGDSYIIDPKAIIKDELYGKLDSTTLEWTDGIFTHILRKITENVRGESSRRHWIIFDGDVDPEWAENLNSVLDDNKLLTLPNGERIQIPPNVRIMFEVETLKYATLATVSRCGMVWFSEDIVKLPTIFYHYLQRLKQPDFDDFYSEQDQEGNEKEKEKEENIEQKTRNVCVEYITKLFDSDDSLGAKAVQVAESLKHVMDYTRIRVIEAFFALIRKGVVNILEYNESHSDFPLEETIVERYMLKWSAISLVWGIGGSLNLEKRAEFSRRIQELINFDLPNNLQEYTIIDYEVKIEDGEWQLWKKRVPNVEIDPQRVTDADLIITTVDTLRHQEILCSWLSEHRPFLLCGPPGSGKTMTLMSTLKALPDFEMIFVNFSSSTTPALLLTTFDQYCEYVKTPNGIVLRPKQPNKWVILFCDEINLPDTDKYNTQPVITFLRQLTEQRGFWRISDKQWVSLEKIQFVGACNPPTDVGRHPLSPRFLRHTPLILVDFPGRDSLTQIYGTFNRAMLKKVPSLRGFADQLTEAMVEFYTRSQTRFTADMQPHYIYSPRELTRWKYALNEALEPLESQEDLVRLWAHEALRLFNDRLVFKDEQEWCEKLVDEVARKCFPTCDVKCLERPILFSTYINKNYISCSQDILREYIQARLKTFNEEELSVQIVVFDSVIEHILRIDRVLKQPLGHLLLVGASGVGKTTLSRFVSWMNNLQVFQIKAGRNYSLNDFDADLREVMKRAGCKGEKLCFIFDESNVLSVSFMERMNALLASGEVPGLFEGEEYMALMNQCKEAASRENKLMDTEEQLYKTFVKNVQRNLHVVFTMNPANPDFSNRGASSPALFNRCVIDWFGEWSKDGLWQVARELTLTIDPPEAAFTKAVIRENIESRHNCIVNTIVFIHNTIQEINKQLAKSAKRYNYITPRDFLDFIKHFVELHHEKKQSLEDQQYHLNVGLNKLKETEEQVKQLQISLDKYKAELEQKEKQANEKLKLMVQEQQQAEAKKENSIKLSKELEIKQVQIKERTTYVETELSEALPALERAQNSVKNIDQRSLTEIKNFKNPPALVKMTLEAVVCCLLGGLKEPTWDEAKKELSKKEFITDVLNFKTDKISDKAKKNIIAKYTGKPEWQIDKINNASKAAGPLADWLVSQLKYADILDRIQPLRDEVTALKAEEEGLAKKNDELTSLISKLEKNIASYKTDYAHLISQVENIKGEMTKVLDKVTRSQKLISNLSTERYRWEGSSESFKEQMATMIGDVLLSSAFLTYIGFFDHFYRKVMMGAWKNQLELAGIKYRSDLSITEFLTKPSDKLQWQAHKLPADDLCTENAIILSKFNRYPLVIDPSGQALDFLLSFYKDKKINQTSFADDSFMKNLETALRFGCPLLVQDVEKIDPILNSVLNKETFKTGGRVLMRVGDQEIDFSPNFVLFMITRDSNATFTPDLCSRVTFVNFTVTPSSLQNQCLNIYLKNERADVEEKRVNLLKLQGEYVVKLRELEDSLLDSLSNVQGNILDNEQVIATLETLKSESGKVQQEMAKSDKVMEEVNNVTNTYYNLAQVSSKIFFAMQSLTTVHYLYQFSLAFFMDTLYNLITKDDKLMKIPKTEPDKRLDYIYNEIFQQTYQRIANSLLNNDKLIFALRLSQIKLSPKMQDFFNQVIKPCNVIETNLSPNLIEGKLKSTQLQQLEELSQKDKYKNLISHLDNNTGRWLAFLDDPNPEQSIPVGWENEEYENSEKSQLNAFEREISVICKELTIIRLFRPDKFTVIASKLVKKVLGESSLDVPPVDMKIVVEKESNSKSPILLSSAPGNDPSFKVEQLVKETNKKLTSVAIGSAEGFDLADKAITAAAKSGSWVLLKNVHLAPQWLSEVEKKIYRLQLHDNFRLFLTTEFNPKIPRTLLKQSYKCVFEPPDGIKASLNRTFKTVLNAARSEKLPVERTRLHFLLAWVHAVIQERLRYTPIGWTKVYEFNEADQRCALDLIDEYIDNLGARNNIDPNKIPWEALSCILTQNLYGGKIDNQYDNKILDGLINQFFSPKSFNLDFELFNAPEGIQPMKMPEVTKFSQFQEWIEKLPSVESPAWSGLPTNVERIVRETLANHVIKKLLEIQDVNEDEAIELNLEEDKKKTEGEGQVKWLKDLGQRIQIYLQILPESLPKLARDSNSIQNPLFRFIEREVTVASNLLKFLRTKLNDLKGVCEGKVQSTQDLRQLATELHSDQIPSSWKRYTILNITASEWISDFKKRVDQFSKIMNINGYQKNGVWMGGLLFPEAYLTATRQYVAQNHQWSLDELDLKIEILDNQTVDDDCFVITNMSIEGAEWNTDTKQLQLNKDLTTSLPPLLCKWVQVQKADIKKLSENEIFVPVYLNKSRANLIFSVKMDCGGIPKNILYQRGLALVAWN